MTSPIMFAHGSGHHGISRASRSRLHEVESEPIGRLDEAYERELAVSLAFSAAKRTQVTRLQSERVEESEQHAAVRESTPVTRTDLTGAGSDAGEALTRIGIALAVGVVVLTATFFLWRYDIGVTGSLLGLGLVGATLTVSSLGFLFETAARLTSHGSR